MKLSDFAAILEQTTHELFFDVQEETFIETERLYVKSYTVYLY